MGGRRRAILDIWVGGWFAVVELEVEGLAPLGFVVLGLRVRVRVKRFGPGEKVLRAGEAVRSRLVVDVLVAGLVLWGGSACRDCIVLMDVVVALGFGGQGAWMAMVFGPGSSEERRFGDCMVEMLMMLSHRGIVTIALAMPLYEELGMVVWRLGPRMSLRLVFAVCRMGWWRRWGVGRRWMGVGVGGWDSREVERLDRLVFVEWRPVLDLLWR